MIKITRLLALGLVLASVSACAVATRIDAAGDVHAFLIGIRDGDKRAFDAHVDRGALKVQVRSRLLSEAARPRVAAPLRRLRRRCAVCCPQRARTTANGRTTRWWRLP